MALRTKFSLVPWHVATCSSCQVTAARTVQVRSRRDLKGHQTHLAKKKETELRRHQMLQVDFLVTSLLCFRNKHEHFFCCSKEHSQWQKTHCSRWFYDILYIYILHTYMTFHALQCPGATAASASQSLRPGTVNATCVDTVDRDVQLVAGCALFTMGLDDFRRF